MMEYINKREAYMLLKDLESAYTKRTIKEAYATAALQIEQMPIADVQPIKHGLWLYSDRYITCAYEDRHYSTCSICGEDSLDEGEYCSHCGAVMDNA
jgi:hypothetical protein